MNNIDIVELTRVGKCCEAMDFLTWDPDREFWFCRHCMQIYQPVILDIDELTVRAVKRAWAETGGNQARVADKLGLTRYRIITILKKHRLFGYGEANRN